MIPAIKSRKPGLPFKVIKWLLIITLAFFALKLITGPIRKSWSNNYLKSGNNFLLQKRFLSAELEYRKAIFLYKNKKAEEQTELAKKAEGNVLALRVFYKQENFGIGIDLVEKADLVPKSAVLGAKYSKELLEKDEYQFAAIAAKQATEMNPAYRDGWLYLGIANYKIASEVEIGMEAKKNYLDLAEKALNRAKTLDPEYKSTLEYLELVNKR